MTFSLAVFPQHSCFEIYPCCHKYQQRLPFYCWVAFCCVDVQLFMQSSDVCFQYLIFLCTYMIDF